MYEDVSSSIMLDKTILNELVNENVIPLFLNKNSKRAVFTALFFIKIVNKFFYNLFKLINFIIFY